MTRQSLDASGLDPEPDLAVREPRSPRLQTGERAVLHRSMSRDTTISLTSIHHTSPTLHTNRAGEASQPHATNPTTLPRPTDTKPHELIEFGNATPSPNSIRSA